MRIWFQSVASLGRNPVWEPYEKVLTKHAQEVARPGTTVDVHGVEIMTSGLDSSHYFEYLNTSQVINNAILAEKEGYDAFALNCMLDPGFFELKEVVDIPIAFALESSCHIACLLAPKFALLAYNDILKRRVSESVKQYGLGERMISSSSFTTTLEALPGAINDPEPVLMGAKDIAKRASEQGADILIPTCGCLNMVCVSNGINEIEGLPLIDTVSAVVKTAELLVDLKKQGLGRVNHGLYTRVPKEELSAVRKMYGVE